MGDGLESPPTTPSCQHFHSDPNDAAFSRAKNLIMVAGHSVYISTTCGETSTESSWFLEPYQQIPGQASTFIDHIRAGIMAAAADSDSLLLFSGGETRKNAGPRSEAQSYWMIAEAANWFGHPEVQERALTEEHARDSFENLLFSICRFRELSGSYPANITVVSYDFKERRFARIHRSAIRFPSSRFFFIGTPMVAAGRAGALAGEEKTIAAFQSDPYGCQGLLKAKRQQRNPFARSLPYPMGCPEIQGIFRHCEQKLYSMWLPWDDSHGQAHSWRKLSPER
eukprot:TRINITY_DN6185_c0_g6_i1.p1 TRINITY_DN6185_c0_g6~~TRINITY_DN6185_c0_g6_i1.p1  ORF type:complete len:282 (-),score=47.48 TRINITY_DN6185_c0_g6_i1:177-1022(-)